MAAALDTANDIADAVHAEVVQQAAAIAPPPVRASMAVARDRIVWRARIVAPVLVPAAYCSPDLGKIEAAIAAADGQITIKGNSPDESVVTQFGRSLEFSNGLFSNLNIETQRQEHVNQLATAVNGGEQPKVQVVDFTIKTAYTPSKANGANNGVQTASAPAAPGTAPAGPAQVAKN